MKSRSNNKPEVMQCTNPYRNVWVVRWDIRKDGDGYAFEEERFEHLPTLDEIRDCVNAYYNRITDEKILKGFQWQGKQVWLSQENQFNYKATHDLAVQTGGKNLPLCFKLGTDDSPSYFRFDRVEDISAFYTAALEHIQQCYTRGWTIKDSVDYSGYTAIINAQVK